MSAQDDKYDQLISSGYSRTDALAELQTLRDGGTLPQNSATSGSGVSSAKADPYGGSSTQAIRKRGSTTQQRVSTDTRSRDEPQQQSSMGAAMQAQQESAPATQQQSGMWQGMRQPTDLVSVQSRLLQSFKK